MTNLTDNLDIQCSNCNTHVDSENVNYSIGVAKCDECHSVFRFDTNDMMEENVSTQNTGGMLNKLLQSQQFIHLSLLVFMVFWNISFLIFLTTSISKGYIVLAAILGVVTAVGLFLTYFLVAALFGSREASPQKLVFSNWGNILPIFGGRHEIIDNLQWRGVYSEQYQYQLATHKEKSTAYKVRGINDRGDKMDLVSELWREEQAAEIEQEINKFIRCKAPQS